MILAVRDPLIKLAPKIKPIGSFTDSLKIKLTFLRLELFCIPIINSKNNEKLNVIDKKKFFKNIY